MNNFKAAAISFWFFGVLSAIISFLGFSGNLDSTKKIYNYKGTSGVGFTTTVVKFPVIVSIIFAVLAIVLIVLGVLCLYLYNGARETEKNENY